MLDVVIIGGSSAGLSAVDPRQIAKGRCRHRRPETL